MDENQRLILQTQYELLASCIMEIMYCVINYQSVENMRPEIAKRKFADRMVEIERIKSTF